jgi:hypothetical protein
MGKVNRSVTKHFAARKILGSMTVHLMDLEFKDFWYGT